MCNLKTFSSKEALLYLNRIQEKDMIAKNELIDKCLYLIDSVIENNYKVAFLYEEFYSVGLEALLNAIESYNLNSKNKTFLNYAREKIVKAISNCFHENLRYNQMLNLETFLEEDYYNVGLFSDVEEEYLVKERNNIIRSIIGKMPEEWQYIIIHRFGFDDKDILTFQEIANNLRLNISTVRLHYQNILDYISVQLKGREMFSLTRKEAVQTWIVVKKRQLVKEKHIYNYYI